MKPLIEFWCSHGFINLSVFTDMNSNDEQSRRQSGVPSRNFEYLKVKLNKIDMQRFYNSPLSGAFKIFPYIAVISLLLASKVFWMYIKLCVCNARRTIFCIDYCLLAYWWRQSQCKCNSGWAHSTIGYYILAFCYRSSLYLPYSKW